MPVHLTELTAQWGRLEITNQLIRRFDGGRALCKPRGAPCLEEGVWEGFLEVASEALLVE